MPLASFISKRISMPAHLLTVRWPAQNMRRANGRVMPPVTPNAAGETHLMPKILIVEDDEMNRDMLSRRLVRRGYDVILAVDGGEGVTRAANDRPDLILMDMSLPEVDGWEATRRLKSSPQTRQIPVIALTAHAMADDERKAMDAGCDDFDTKPVELNRLLTKIEKLLDREAV